MPTHYLYKCDRCDYEGARYRNVTRCECGGNLVRVPMSTQRERVATAQHEIWAHWMRYLFSQGAIRGKDGAHIIYPENVKRWKRQMNTPYSQLSQNEQASDLRQADEVLEVL